MDAEQIKKYFKKENVFHNWNGSNKHSPLTPSKKRRSSMVKNMMGDFSRKELLHFLNHDHLLECSTTDALFGIFVETENVLTTSGRTRSDLSTISLSSTSSSTSSTSSITSSNSSSFCRYKMTVERQDLISDSRQFSPLKMISRSAKKKPKNNNNSGRQNQQKSSKKKKGLKKVYNSCAKLLKNLNKKRNKKERMEY